MKRNFSPGNLRYSPPEAEEILLLTEQGLLYLSTQDTSLAGAGVDESDADDNGSNIW